MDAVTFESHSLSCYGKILPIMEGVKTIITPLGDLASFFRPTRRPQSDLAAGKPFLRKQAAMFHVLKGKPHMPDTPIRIALVLLSRLFNCREAPVVVPPWPHRSGTAEMPGLVSASGFPYQQNTHDLARTGRYHNQRPFHPMVPMTLQEKQLLVAIKLIGPGSQRRNIQDFGLAGADIDIHIQSG